MNQSPAVIGQHAVDDIAEFVIAFNIDVLQHTHRHENVEFTGDIATFVLGKLDTLVQLFPAGAFACIGNLLAGQVIGLDRHAMITRHVQCQRTPAAAGFNHPLTGFKPQLTADVFQV